MKTPIEQILEGFDGVTLAHFVPVVIILIPIIFLEVRRARNPIKTSRRWIWVKGKGFQPAWRIDTRDKKAVAALEEKYNAQLKRK